jgi:hypothetical protein
MPHPLPRILCAVPQALHVRFEIAKAIQTLAAPEQECERQPIEALSIELDSELIKECARESTAKAAVDDPKHPGWPAHTPEGKGGEFRPKDIALGSLAISGPAQIETQETSQSHIQLAMEAIDPSCTCSSLFSKAAPAARLIANCSARDNGRCGGAALVSPSVGAGSPLLGELSEAREPLKMLLPPPLKPPRRLPPGPLATGASGK